MLVDTLPAGTEPFARGKRSVVYVFTRKGVQLALKVERDDIAATGRLVNEAKFLRLLNPHGVGPHLLDSDKKSILYEFVAGKLILDYLASAKNPWPVLRKIFLQCRVMDSLGINKLEMHKPVKHIFVKRGTPVMIDFERCYYAKRPKNVSQFAQFLLSSRVRPLLRGKVRYRSDSVRSACQRYQKDQSVEHFKKILACFSC